MEGRTPITWENHIHFSRKIFLETISRQINVKKWPINDYALSAKTFCRILMQTRKLKNTFRSVRRAPKICDGTKHDSLDLCEQTDVLYIIAVPGCACLCVCVSCLCAMALSFYGVWISLQLFDYFSLIFDVNRKP